MSWLLLNKKNKLPLLFADIKHIACKPTIKVMSHLSAFTFKTVVFEDIIKISTNQRYFNDPHEENKEGCACFFWNETFHLTTFKRSYI